MQRLFYFLLCLLPLIGSAAYAAPSRVEAKYDILKSGFKVAEMNETFTRSDDHYRIVSVTRATGLLALFKPEVISVISEGNITAQGLQPVTFDYQRKIDTNKIAHADFDWPAKKLTLSNPKGKHSVDLPVGTQDRLSAMYQFMFWPLQHASSLKFNMTNGSKLDDYSYSVAVGPRTHVPLGQFSTLYLASPARANGGRTEIWLARERDNIPCKMIITEGDGSKLTQNLTALHTVP